HFLPSSHSNRFLLARSPQPKESNPSDGTCLETFERTPHHNPSEDKPPRCYCRRVPILLLVASLVPVNSQCHLGTFREFRNKVTNRFLGQVHLHTTAHLTGHAPAGVQENLHVHLLGKPAFRSVNTTWRFNI